jgi:hypothetical protein
MNASSSSQSDTFALAINGEAADTGHFDIFNCHDVSHCNRLMLRRVGRKLSIFLDVY